MKKTIILTLTFMLMLMFNFSASAEIVMPIMADSASHAVVAESQMQTNPNPNEILRSLPIILSIGAMQNNGVEEFVIRGDDGSLLLDMHIGDSRIWVYNILVYDPRGNPWAEEIVKLIYPESSELIISEYYRRISGEPLQRPDMGSIKAAYGCFEKYNSIHIKPKTHI